MNAKQKGKLLKEAQVILNRVYQKNTAHNIILSWRVTDYEKLSHNVMYFQIYESIDIKCAFRLFKKDELLCLSISSNSIPQNALAEFLILDEVNKVSVTNKAEMISDGVYVAQFPNEQFLFPDSHFLLNGMLTVAFKYASDFYSTYRETRLEETEILADLDELCCDLKNMYLDALYYDFCIHVRDYTFKSHKFILAARSKYFHNLLEVNKDVKEHRLSGDIFPGIMHEVLLYMYSGEMKDMDIDCMLKVYKLAVDLGISSLCSRCLEYFAKRTDVDNYMDISKFAVRFGLTELKNRIIHFVQKEMPYIEILDVFKQIKEEVERETDTAKSS